MESSSVTISRASMFWVVTGLGRSDTSMLAMPSVGGLAVTGAEASTGFFVDGQHRGGV